jgi:hypothetical protein
MLARSIAVDCSDAAGESDTAISKAVAKLRGHSRRQLMLWQVLVLPPYVLHNSLPCTVEVEVRTRATSCD